MSTQRAWNKALEPGSLRARLVLVLALLLVLLVLASALALERAFEDAARSAREERLLAQLYLLMAAAESVDGTLVMPKTLAESRLSFPGSGLTARIFDGEGRMVWQSPSAVDAIQPAPVRLAQGQRRFELVRLRDGSGYIVGAFGVSWATGPRSRPYTFAVAEDMAAMRREVARYRGSLYRWLGSLSLLTLVLLALALRWGLAPLRRAAREVAALESGSQQRIEGDYPSELRALTDNLNALIAHERVRRERLDQALGDLAHSLKTPLAVIRGAVDRHQESGERAGIAEQVDRMSAIVEYQLQRARMGSRQTGALAPRIDPGRVAERLLASLAKVYRDKSVDVHQTIEPGAVFRGCEDDLMELLGNLLDNAFKWCRTRVSLDIRGLGDALSIAVEDDGPGIGHDQVEAVLGHGVRADTNTPGHGIGLAVAREIASAYGGGIEISASSLGGAAVRVRLAG